jgi:hypothetical protein
MIFIYLHGANKILQMKNTGLTLLFVALMATTANAQVGFELGLNMANLAIKSNGTTLKTTYKPGFAIGIPANIALGQHFYFEPGLFYEMTGCKIPGPPVGKYSINTITVPLNFEYKTGEKCGNRFFIGIGAFIGYNVGGSVDNGSDIETLTIGTATTDDLKALEFGADINLGYQLKKRLYARARYQLGLSNLSPDGADNNTIKSSAFGITVGYLFGRCESFGRAAGFGSGGGDHWRGMSKSKYSRKPRHLRNRTPGY